ncbi:hypothetical protein AB0K51_20940 [Kitasatospora sp. NPDC049285]|uniref:hypothetical protein n=1 Tax=Kitasatospora sp. NPDC049285 TaxID=3157096 RepID=UPI00341AED2F
MNAPATPDHLARLHRADGDADLSAVLESAEEGLLAPLHQFLEQAAEVFRQRGDLRSAAALDTHAADIEGIGNELHHLAADLASAAGAARAAAANAGRFGAVAAAAEPLCAAAAPSPPTRSR